MCAKSGGAAALVLEEYNHFEVLEPLGNPCSELARATLKLMGSRALEGSSRIAMGASFV